MAEAVIDRLNTNEGPFSPGQKVTLFRNVIYNTVSPERMAQQFWKVSVVDAKGNELQTLCQEDISVDGQLRFGVRNLPDGDATQQCDPEPGTQQYKWYIPEDVGSVWRIGFKTWMGTESEPPYPEPGTQEAREGRSRAWEVQTTAEEPVPLPGPGGDAAAAGLMLLSGVSTYGATNEPDWWPL